MIKLFKRMLSFIWPRWPKNQHNEGPWGELPPPAPRKYSTVRVCQVCGGLTSFLYWSSEFRLCIDYFHEFKEVNKYTSDWDANRYKYL